MISSQPSLTGAYPGEEFEIREPDLVFCWVHQSELNKMDIPAAVVADLLRQRRRR
jgi:hypothetical protein